MRNWKIIMMVLCLALCLPGLFGMAEAKGGKDMVKEKTAYVTKFRQFYRRARTY